MPDKNSSPAPLDTRRGKQKDDNIDDMGRRPDGRVEEQPVRTSEGGARGNPKQDR